MVHVESRQLETVEGSLPCDVYAHRRSGRDAPTVAFIHGMSLLGHRDPRQVKVQSALPRPASESMHHTSMKSLIFAFRKSMFSGSKLLYWRLSNKVRNESVFSQCQFSAGLSLLATAELRGQNKLKGLCSIGGFSDVVSCLHYLIDDPEADEYGKLIIYRNYLTEFEALYPGLTKLLRCGCTRQCTPS